MAERQTLKKTLQRLSRTKEIRREIPKTPIIEFGPLSILGAWLR
jgi:hypothetical protein